MRRRINGWRLLWHHTAAARWRRAEAWCRDMAAEMPLFTSVIFHRPERSAPQ